ncbi:MAG: GtrA family protein, partial [Campylobacterota bacterium]|nr:GtrA family protein [Campylobacterota bacterium]
MSKIKKELKRFLVAGLSAVGTDLATYYILLNFLSHDVAKAISFLLGTVVAFVINKYWTFEKHEKSYKEIFQFG